MLPHLNGLVFHVIKDQNGSKICSTVTEALYVALHFSPHLVKSDLQTCLPASMSTSHLSTEELCLLKKAQCFNRF